MTFAIPGRCIISCITWARRLLLLPTVLSLVGLVTLSCSKQEESKEAHLSRASDYFSSAQYDKAEQEYRKVLRLAPADAVAERQLGIIYEEQGQLLQAFGLLKKAAKREPDNLEVQLKLGRTYLAGHELKETRDAALQVLDKQPDNEQALILLADTAVSPNDIEEVQKLIEAFREKDQDRPAYHVALGELALKEKDQARAEREFQTALKLDPKSAAAHIGLAVLYWAHNDLKSAGEEFKAAADLSPPRSPVRLRYADFLMKTGAAPEAKTILQDINRKFPDYLPPRVSLMKIACAEHNDDACAERVQNILAQDSIDPDAVYQDGVLSLAKGDAAKAIRDFEFLSNTLGQNAEVRYQLAQAYLLYAKGIEDRERTKAVDSAENRLTEAVKLAPHFAQAIILLSELKIRKGAPAAAVNLLTPLTTQKPQIAQAQYLLAAAYLAQHQPDQALAVYRRMVELFPKDPQPSFLAGTMLLAQGQPAEAREAFEKSLEISPDYLPPAEKLVDLDIADKRFTAALDRAQKLIDKDPKQAQRWAIRGKVYLAQQDFAHAEPDLLKAIELDPKLEPSYLLLAQLYVASDKREDAVKKLSAFVDQNKNEGNKIAPALLQLAFLQQSLKHFNESRDAYEKLLALNPNFAPALNNLAVLYSDHLGQLDKAYDLAKKARENAANDPHSADTLGWILYKKGDYSSAIPLLQESASKLADQPDIQFHLGMAQYMLGRADLARSALQRAVEASVQFPGQDEARKRLGVLAIDAETADAAVRKELQDDIAEQPNDPEARLRLGQLQEREGALDQAVQTYEKIIDFDPHFAPAARRLALLYSQRPAEDTKSYQLATQARQAYPDDPDLARVLGILSYRRAYYPKSAEVLKQVAARQSDNAELFYYLGEAHYQLKQWNECDDALKRAITLDLSPKLADQAKKTLAECSAQREKTKGIESYRSGDFSQSAELLKHAAANSKDDPELLYYLGQSYRQLNEKNECKDTFQHALNLNLSPELADEAKRALADCS